MKQVWYVLEACNTKKLALGLYDTQIRVDEHDYRSYIWSVP